MDWSWMDSTRIAQGRYGTCVTQPRDFTYILQGRDGTYVPQNRDQLYRKRWWNSGVCKHLLDRLSDYQMLNKLLCWLVGYKIQYYFYISIYIYTDCLAMFSVPMVDNWISQYWVKVSSRCHLVHHQPHSILLRSRPVFRADRPPVS
jgi:hypothetical protein